MDKKITRSKIGVIAFILIATVGAAGTVYASGGGAGPTWWGLSVEKLWDFLYRTLNFAVLVFILAKFGGKPIANILKGRRLTIKEQFEDLEAKKAEANRTYQDYEDKLARIEQEVTKIIETAISHGEAEKERIIEEANRAAEDIKRQAEMAIQHEMAEAQLQLREEVANQAVVIAEELIKKSLQKQDQVRLVEDYLEKVGAIQ